MARDRDASVRHSGLGFGDASDMEVQGNCMQEEQKAERCLLETTFMTAMRWCNCLEII